MNRVNQRRNRRNQETNRQQKDQESEQIRRDDELKRLIAENAEKVEKLELEKRRQKKAHL